jgi:hypothetical protein
MPDAACRYCGSGARAWRIDRIADAGNVREHRRWATRLTGLPFSRRRKTEIVGRVRRHCNFSALKNQWV